MQFGFYGNFFVRPNGPLRKGQVVRLHAHKYPHVLCVFKGRVHVHAVLPEGQVIERDYGMASSDPRYCLIAAGVAHEITALEDDSEFDCLFSLRTPDGEVVEYPTGYMDAFV